MRKFLLFTIVLLFLGCSTSKGLKTVKYDPWKSGWKLFIDIPRSYKFEKIPEAGSSYYCYRDGYYIYIGSPFYSPNRTNIDKLGDSISRYRFQNNDLIIELIELLGEELMKPLPDTLILSGIDKNGLYWREILITDKNIALGYLNVPKEKKEIFDQSLDSFRQGRKKK